MVLAFHSAKHPFDIVETPNTADAEVEARGPERRTSRWSLELLEARAQGRVDEGLHWLTAGPRESLEPDRDVLI